MVTQPAARLSSAFERSLPQPPHSVSWPVPPTSQSLPRSPKIASSPSVAWSYFHARQLPWLSTETQVFTRMSPTRSSLLRKNWFGNSVRSELPVQVCPLGDHEVQPQVWPTPLKRM